MTGEDEVDTMVHIEAPDFRLVITDVDGTLMGSVGDSGAAAEFHVTLNTFRRRYNAVWVVITGRTLAEYERVANMFESPDCRPDFVITRSSRAHVFSAMGYRPHVQLTTAIRFLSRGDSRQVKRTMRRIRPLMLSSAPSVRVVTRDEGGTCYQFRKAGDAQALVKAVGPEAVQCHGLKVLVHKHEIDVIPVHYDKGYCVLALASFLSISSDQILAIADGRKDLSMMDEGVARWTGCPANAAPELRTLIHRRSGHLSRRQHLRGVVDIMRSYMEGRVDPCGDGVWHQEDEVRQPWSRISVKRMDRSYRYDVVIASLGAYAVLAVLASYGLVPGKALILLPFTLVRWVLDLF